MLRREWANRKRLRLCAWIPTCRLQHCLIFARDRLAEPHNVQRSSGGCEMVHEGGGWDGRLPSFWVVWVLHSGHSSDSFETGLSELDRQGGHITIWALGSHSNRLIVCRTDVESHSLSVILMSRQFLCHSPPLWVPHLWLKQSALSTAPSLAVSSLSTAFNSLSLLSAQTGPLFRFPV